MNWTTHWHATAPSPTHPDRNEDSWWIAASGQAAAVIDGMGGYRRQSADGEVGGEHAAQLATTVLREMLDEWRNDATLDGAKQQLRMVIEAVNRRIWETLNWSGVIPVAENRGNQAASEISVGVAMTVAVAVEGGARALMAQHGDTHGYVYKAELGLLQVTEDQDRLMWDRLNGVLRPDEAHAISEAIDHFDGVNLTTVRDQRVMRYFFDKNIFGALGVAADASETGWSPIKLAAGDRIALLSDGAYANLSVTEIQNLVSQPDRPAETVLALAKQRSQLARFPDPNNPFAPFNMRATQDDMTVVVVEVGDVSE